MKAAAFIIQNNLTLVEYIDILFTNDSEVQDLLNNIGDLRRDSESWNSVFRTWLCSVSFSPQR